MKPASLSFALALLALVVLSAGCEKDDANPSPAYDIPETYTFDNVDYSGQLQRLSMLLEMKAYMASANTAGVVLDAARLRAMYANDAAGAAWKQTYDASKQLRDKTLSNQQALFEDLIGQLAAASTSTVPAAQGQAGVAVSLDGSKKYLLDARGVEPAQLVEKGLMGACFYYQATAVYLGEDKMSADNVQVTPGQGTALEHHWDEAFGYFGVPRDFPLNTDGVVFWGQYCTRRDALLGANRRIMDAFLKGRAAISNKDLKTRDEAIEEVRGVWEEVVVGTALNYLNQAITGYDDFAVRAHALSEGAAFIYSLQFNPAKRISNQEVGELLILIGGSADMRNLDFYQVSTGKLSQARDRLAAAYDLMAKKDQF